MKREIGSRRGGNRRSALLFILFSSLLCLAFAPAASAAWILPAGTISSAGRDAYTPQLAIGPNGLTTVVWTRDTASRRIVEASTRQPGLGAFSAAVDLSPLAGGDISDPRVAIGPDGATTVVYSFDDSGQEQLGARSRAGGSASFSDAIAPATGPDVYVPRVVIGPDRATTVSWEYFDGGPQVSAATRLAGQGSYGAAQTVTPDQAVNPSMSVGGDGKITFAYVVLLSGLAQTATGTSTSPFASIQTLSNSGGSASQPQVASGVDGTTAVVWRRWNGSAEIVQASVRSPSGIWLGPVNLSQAGQSAFTPQVAVAPDGTVTAVWSRPSGGDSVVQASTKAARANGFSSPVNLSQPGKDAKSVRLAVGPDGRTTVVWEYSNGGVGSVVQAVRRFAGSSAFSSPVALSQAGQDAKEPAVADAQTGSPCSTYPTVVWKRSDGSKQRVQQTSAPVGCIDGLRVNGPSRVRRGGRATFRIAFENTGLGPASDLSIAAAGRGVRASSQAGTLASGRSETVSVRLRFKKRGRIRTSFTVTSTNASQKLTRKTIRVR